MESTSEEKLVSLMERILDVRDRAHELTDDKNSTIAQVEACNAEINSIVADYRAVRDAASPAERDQIERKFGRKVTDMLRDTACLPRLAGGSERVPLATDETWTTGVRTIPRRSAGEIKAQAPPDDWRQPTPEGPRVGAEIDAWCGPCKRITTHRIIAMVGDEPKQVVCTSCDARHNYRLTPARGKKQAGASSSRDPIQRRAEARSRAKEQQRTALQKELTAATDVVPFAKRRRYKAGQIIEHPEHGRGKVENVIRGVIVVRFRSGLKSLTL